MEKLDKLQLARFLEGAKELLAEKLRNGDKTADPGTLLKAAVVLDRAAGYHNANVGLVHIAGMISAELMGFQETQVWQR